MCSGHAFCDGGTGEGQGPDFGHLSIEDFGVDVDQEGVARVLLSSPGNPMDVQGFTLAIENPATLDLVDINIAGTVTESVGADFVSDEIVDPDLGGLLRVVMDTLEGSGARTIPASSDPVHIANYVYTCDAHPGAPAPPSEHEVALVTGSLLMADGRLSNPIMLLDGSAFCQPDLCPDDPDKAEPGVCGCGTPDTDTDGDGLLDCDDACPNSDSSDEIVIDGCNTGVENQLFDDGCSMADVIAACAVVANDHGQFVRCVAHLTNDWKKAGLISPKDTGPIKRCAAKADLP